MGLKRHLTSSTPSSIARWIKTGYGARMNKDTPDGDRIAKVLSRAGVASRRDAERMISEGRVKVNGKPVTSPALNVVESDRIQVDGKQVDAPEPTRLWLYHKPAGLVTSDNDELGRATVFEQMPEGMPRVMSVGRLDLTSEGLLILTNDGEIKRKLELPATGWLRRYRVRINGSVSEAKLEELRRGITVDGVDYMPMDATFDRQQGANAWLTIAIREGKNREIRRVMEALGVTVNRLIRTSYGPFQLGNLAPGAVEELPRRQVRDQLGLIDPEDAAPAKPVRSRKVRGTEAKPAGPIMRSTKGPRPGEDAPKPARSFTPRPLDEDRPPRPRTEDVDRPERNRGPRDSTTDDRPRAAYKPRADGDTPRPAYKPRADGDKPRGPYKPRAEGDAPRGPYKPRADGDKPRGPYKPRADGDKPRGPYKPRAEGDRSAAAKSYGPRTVSDGDRPRGPAKPRTDGDRPYKPRRSGDGDAAAPKAYSRPYTPRAAEDGARPARSFPKPRPTDGAKPYGPKPDGAGPRGPRSYGTKSHATPRANENGPRKPYGPRTDGAPRRDGDNGPRPPRKGPGGGKNRPE
jgi:23S rRNA pseudouridine2605 synthase